MVLVEGDSDRRALEALARLRGRDLAADGIAVLAMGGSKNIVAYLERFGPRGSNIGLAGLCDAAEERDVRRGLERAGLGTDLSRAGMEALGFYVCEADLEDELIRSLGVAAVERIVESQGELGAFRTLQKQPAQRRVSVDQQLRRFLGTRGGRKIRYASLLVEALDPTRVPRPLDGVIRRL